MTPFLGAILLAATAILAIGWSAAFFLRRRAAWENALWRTVLLVLLALPAAQAVGPRVFAAWRPLPQLPEIALTPMIGSGSHQNNVAAVPGAPAKLGDRWGMIRRSLLLLWGAGTLASLGALARSAWKVRCWVRASSPLVSGEECQRLVESARIAGVCAPDLGVSARLRSPVLVGWRRPCILVPNREMARQREVLLHELAHLRRADLWWMTFERVVAAVWWFHPLAWGVGRRLERSAEDVCDDLVLTWTQDAANYAGQLMQLARQVGVAGGWRPLAGVSVTGFRSELGKRVARVLEPGRTLRVEVGRRGAWSLATGAALLLTLLAAASPSQGQSPAGAATPRAVAGARPAGPAGDAEAIAALTRKADSILIPNLEFRRTTLSDGIEFLRLEARRIDSSTGPDGEKLGVNITFRSPPPPRSDDSKRITLSLTNVPLLEAVRQVARAAGFDVVVEPYALCLTPLAGTAAASPAKVEESAAGVDQEALARMNQKVRDIIIPFVEFHLTTVQDGMEFLRQEARRVDPNPDLEKRGVNINVSGPGEYANKRVTLSLSNVPLVEALRYVASQADLKVVVEPYGLRIEPASR